MYIRLPRSRQVHALTFDQIPGLLHAWYIIAKYPEPERDYEAVPREEGGRVTYVFVNSDDRQGRQPKQQQRMNYGTHASNNNASNAASSSAPTNQPQPSRNDNAGEGRSDGPPPSYAQVVAGDHKVQSQE